MKIDHLKDNQPARLDVHVTIEPIGGLIERRLYKGACAYSPVVQARFVSRFDCDACCATCFSCQSTRNNLWGVIVRIRHKGLREFWENGQSRRLNADWLARVDRILNALDLARSAADIDLPGFRLHPLKGDYKGYYAVDVSGNWRIVFGFEGADTTDIDLIDYH